MDNMETISFMKNTLLYAIASLVLMLSSHYSYAVRAFSLSELHVADLHNQEIAIMTIDDLKSSFKEVTIHTKTPWSDKRYETFIGVHLLDVLERFDLDKYDNIEGFAANDFSTRISLQDIREFNPVLAYGKKCPTKDEGCEEGSYVPLTIKDSGPIYLVWSFDDLPEGVDPRDHSKWVWYIVGVKPVA